MAVLAQCLTQINIYWRNAENEVFFKFISGRTGMGVVACLFCTKPCGADQG